MKVAYLVIGAIVLAIVAGAGGFFGGITYAQAQAQNTVSTFARTRAIQNQDGNGQGTSSGANAANNPCGFPGGQAFQSAQGGAQGGGQGNGPTGAQQGNANGATVQDGQGRRQGGQFGGGFGGFGGAQLGSCVARGQIKSVNGDTVEISTAANVVTIKVNDATVISKTDRGTISDLKVGDRVTVFSKETGTSPTASGIQLQPAVQQQQQ